MENINKTADIGELEAFIYRYTEPLGRGYGNI